MKWKLKKLLLYVNLLTLLCIVLFSLISVADNIYSIEVTDNDYIFLKTVGSENLKFNYYTITIKLKNNGAEETDDITLKIWEEEEGENSSIGRNASIKPGEIKVFSFTDWIIKGTGEHTVMYEYYPTDITKIKNFNSGSGFFKINDGSIKQENNAPGFEFVIVLMGLISIYLIKRKKVL